MNAQHAEYHAAPEAVIGRWLAERGVRERLVLVTKGGQGVRGAGVTEGDFAVAIEAELTTSLEMLGTDQADLYLLHRDSRAFAVGTIIDALNAELRRGRVRAIGASNWEYERIEQANAYAREHGLHGFSMISNNLALARPALPFQRGSRLARPAPARPAAGVLRPGARLLLRPLRPAPRIDDYDRRMIYFARLQRAEQLGPRYSATHWLLHHPHFGPRNRDELTSCLEAALPLAPDETRRLDSGTVQRAARTAEG